METVKARTRIGIIGCGVISEIYLKNLKQFPMIEITACADLITEKAIERARQFDIPRAVSVEELLNDDQTELVLNLTIPKAHTEIAKAALNQGKNFYTEKPLAADIEDAKEILALAKSKNLKIGCAPDTFLGGAMQTCRKLIDDGWIGRPIAATAFFMGRGPENWHPNPDFFYQSGAGPVFDMGPYYLTALVSLLGPVQYVNTMAQITHPVRTITSKPHYGEKINVKVPTHVTGILNFECGVIATTIISFDIMGSGLPHIEIYGTDGTLSIPDPNFFGGPIRIKKPGSEEWREIPFLFEYTDNWRGIGLVDMANALRSGRPHRANGEVGYHVLEIMNALSQISPNGIQVPIHSRCERPSAMKSDLLKNGL